MWSAALDAILTTLRYLAPATLLTLFWGQQSFLFRLLKHIDSAFRAIVFSSEEQKQAVLQWLAEAGPVRVEHLDTVWRHGWVLCGVLDAAMPGACAGHPPTRLSLKHAQAIADHYLGVEPVFTRQELELNDSLSKHQEWKLATYLDRIRQALSKVTPPVSKPTSPRTSPESVQFTLDYVAKGSGLTAAQLNYKMYFKIYPTSQQSMDPGEVTILIRGPRDTYGMNVLPPVLGKAQMIRQKLLGLQAKPNYTETALPITQGATYLRAFGKNDMTKTYFIPKAKYYIEIDAEIQEDHAKVGYVVTIEGKYEISITSRGQNIVGSPFTMKASNNIIGILENESYCLEDGEEIDIVDVKTDRKVVLRIVDFVTEKMLLRENGSLEKITDDEAKSLMASDNFPTQSSVYDSIVRRHDVPTTIVEEFQEKSNKFNKVASKVVKMNRICKIFNDVILEKQLASSESEKSFILARNQLTIPDIVNSTFADSKTNPFMVSDKRDKFIIPEKISVSLRMEKATPLYDKEELKCITLEKDSEPLNVVVETNTPDSLETLEEHIEDDILMERLTSSSNPFLNETYEQNFGIEKDLRTFVKTEYERNNSQNEETEDSSIKIIIEENSPSPTNTNPFIDPEIIHLERPKTPVLKIITDQVKDRDVFVDPNIADEILGNEFINPFFMHHHQSSHNVNRLPITDFIIGAPVSLPPLIRASTPEPNMESIIITDNKSTEESKNDTNQDNSVNDVSSSVFSTPLHTNVIKTKAICNLENNNASISSTFHSLDSNLTDNVEILSLSNSSDFQGEPYHMEEIRSDRDVTPKKDMWDSAYVSIDDSNSSPDSNNNDNTPLCEITSKQKFSPSDGSNDFSKMGPAERELWQTCSELNVDGSRLHEEVKPSKWEIKRPLFTPIIEETDRSISSGMKDLRKIDSASSHLEVDPVTVAFAELNDMYHEYFPTSEDGSNVVTDDKENQRNDKQNITGRKSVDSASDVSDVKRHAKDFEGKISEVQSNVTESGSASQILHINKNEQNISHSKDETQFGDSTRTNIVTERKQYWDEKIRQIEANSEERAQQKKRRLSSKHLRHNDSLTKRRGKQIVKNFLGANEHQPTADTKKVKDSEVKIKHRRSSQISVEYEDSVQTDVKLVEKWRKYWDDKLETEKDETDTTCFRTKSPRSKEQSKSPHEHKQSVEDIIQLYNRDSNNKPPKQELPEEVFKAFETSPKRFFGTSRKQILNKIDTFLGKPSTADNSSADVSGATHDTGLVSSRISLFHTMSKSEELPWARRKCQSMHNIFLRKDSEKRISIDENFINISDNLIDCADEKTNLVAETIQNQINKASIDDKNKTEEELVKTQLKEKRTRMSHTTFNKTFDASVYKSHPQETTVNVPTSVQKTIKDMNKQDQHLQKYKPNNTLRKSSVSKSEMDIFSKITNKPDDDDLDKYKSCDELPKINVKNFISLYESVSKTDVKSKPVKNNRTNIGFQRPSQISSSSGAVNKLGTRTSHYPTIATKPIAKPHTVIQSNADLTQSFRNNHSIEDLETISNISFEPKSVDSVDIEVISTDDIEKETTYLSLSDIELEIIEKSDKSVQSIPKTNEEPAHIDYKSRFKMAKQFFQSLEELREVKKPPKLNECQELLFNKSTESLENDRPQKRVKKNIKSHSMPSSEISKIWSQLQEHQNPGSSTKLVKISEKFNVEDLFSDVMEGKLSRQGSLRGIPHKKAVLEAFRSMENLTDSKLSSYELTASQLNDFANENQIKNAQTYLSEYPYLPTTDPSKYHSRLDTKASGLISLKELMNQKPRRNSVPDLRLNAKFTVDL